MPEILLTDRRTAAILLPEVKAVTSDELYRFCLRMMQTQLAALGMTSLKIISDAGMAGT